MGSKTETKQRVRRMFGSVRTLPSGRFQALYTAPDGRRLNAPRAFSTEQQADDWLTTQRAAMIEGRWMPPDLGSDDLSGYAVAWLTGREDLKPSTRSLYAGLIDRHLSPYLGKLPLASITPPVVRQWYAKLGKVTGPTARAQAYRLLRTIMGDAVRDGMIGTNPCVIRGAGQDKHPEREPLTVAELDKLVAAMPERWRFMAQAAAWTALRFGELVELRRRDVVIGSDAATISVQRSAKYIDCHWTVTDPKTAAGVRTVTVPPHLVDALREHLDTYAADGPDGLVFPTTSGQRLTNSDMSAMIRKARDVIGKPGLHFHDLRHTGATMAAQAGATTKELMARMGHASPRAALIYQHATQERDAELARRLSEMAALPANVVPLRAVA